MGKGKMGFERVPLKHVRRLLKEQNQAQEKSQDLNADDKNSVGNQSRSNVQKHRAQPKRNIGTEGEDHPLGLWINKEIFRKHRNRPPQMALLDATLYSNNRYLALDSVRNSQKVKPKRKVNQTTVRKGA